MLLLFLLPLLLPFLDLFFLISLVVLSYYRSFLVFSFPRTVFVFLSIDGSVSVCLSTVISFFVSVSSSFCLFGHLAAATNFLSNISFQITSPTPIYSTLLCLYLSASLCFSVLVHVALSVLVSVSVSLLYFFLPVSLYVCI